ncbi:hypothetical protein Tco_0210757 [Tanacetum coccineum]
MPHCNSFYWIDHGIPNEWYKTQLLKLYLTLNDEARAHFLGQLSAQEKLEILQDDFKVYQIEIEIQMEAMEIKKEELETEITKLKKNTTFGRKFMQTVAGDDVASIKRRRRDLSSDGVKNFTTVSGRGRLKR